MLKESNQTNSEQAESLSTKEWLNSVWHIYNTIKRTSTDSSFGVTEMMQISQQNSELSQFLFDADDLGLNTLAEKFLTKTLTKAEQAELNEALVKWFKERHPAPKSNKIAA